MLTQTKRVVNECTCDACGWKWDTLKMPTHCPQCRTRQWNGTKRTGRPPELAKPLPTRKKRPFRFALSHYDED